MSRRLSDGVRSQSARVREQAMSNEEKKYDHYIKMQYLLMGDFLAALDMARKNSVGEEWLFSFFESIKTVRESSFKEAISFANKEWDL